MKIKREFVYARLSVNELEFNKKYTKGTVPFVYFFDYLNSEKLTLPYWRCSLKCGCWLKS